MSYDYQKKEIELLKVKQTMNTIENNISKFTMGAVIPPEAFGETIQKQLNNDRDYKSRISKFCLLKTLLNTANLIHLNELELVYWHIINIKMMEVGLWSAFKFLFRDDNEDLIDMLMITALKAKKVCNSEEEYLIYQEFVFHNKTLSYIYADLEKSHTHMLIKDKRGTKGKGEAKLTLR